MKKNLVASVLAGAFVLGAALPAQAEILAMMNYESKPPETLEALNLGGSQERREGIAVIDVDPQSENFGKILMDIPMPADQIVHHIFYDRTATKAYVTSLASPSLQVIDMEIFPYRLTTIPIEGCSMAEDVIFDEANERWFLTCMNSANVFVGDVHTDEVLAEISLPDTFPHGLAVSTEANRILVTSTVSGDLATKDDRVSVVDATTYEVLGHIRLSTAPEPAGESPVEILFAPGADTPTAYVTNLFGGNLWMLTWDEDAQEFAAEMVFDFTTLEAGVALEMYFNNAGDRLYVTTGVPGQLHILDISGGLGDPQLITSIATGGGAHHVAFTPDERYAFVQNALLNLPGLDDGAVTVIDLESQEVIASMDTLKNAGFNPNCIVLLPEWNHFAGH